VCKELHMRNERGWQLSKRGLRPCREELAEFVRQNMEAAATCGRKPPDSSPPCKFCGGPTADAIL